MEHKYCSTERKVCYGDVELGTKGPLSFFISTTSQIFQHADGTVSRHKLSVQALGQLKRDRAGCQCLERLDKIRQKWKIKELSFRTVCSTLSKQSHLTGGHRPNFRLSWRIWESVKIWQMRSSGHLAHCFLLLPWTFHTDHTGINIKHWVITLTWLSFHLSSLSPCYSQSSYIPTPVCTTANPYNEPKCAWAGAKGEAEVNFWLREQKFSTSYLNIPCKNA